MTAHRSIVKQAVMWLGVAGATLVLACGNDVSGAAGSSGPCGEGECGDGICLSGRCTTRCSRDVDCKKPDPKNGDVAICVKGGCQASAACTPKLNDGKLTFVADGRWCKDGEWIQCDEMTTNRPCFCGCPIDQYCNCPAGQECDSPTCAPRLENTHACQTDDSCMSGKCYLDKDNSQMKCIGRPNDACQSDAECEHGCSHPEDGGAGRCIGVQCLCPTPPCAYLCRSI